MKCALCFSVNMLISIILNYKVSIFDLLVKPQRSEVYVWPNRLLSCCYQLHSLLFDMQHDKIVCVLVTSPQGSRVWVRVVYLLAYCSTFLSFQFDMQQNLFMKNVLRLFDLQYVRATYLPACCCALHFL